MTPEESATCLKVLAAIAWADGSISEVEREGLVEFITQTGGFEDADVREALSKVQPADEALLEEVRGLSLTTLALLLSFAHDMIHAEPKASPREMSIYRRVACARLGESGWDKLLEWLAAQQRADMLYDELFEDGSGSDDSESDSED